MRISCSVPSSRNLFIMSRRIHSHSPSPPRSAKRAKTVTQLTSESFRNGVVLAPMVRSGALPTRLFALKHGATLVWAPEIVDKAILHSERAVDPITGVISYNGQQNRAIFTSHPIEKPYLIYQIGSADPALAVQAAKKVLGDVSGFDLNCGCPKPFSTHCGMGAALLTNPDLLCSILVALREAIPPEITLSAKIRLLPSQEDTLELVRRILATGVNALTVHCRTRNMRDRDKAMIERLKDIVNLVKATGKDIAVIENGDCISAEDAKRVRETTGADSVMIARAAEANPSCFSNTPLTDIHHTLVPAYLRLAKYLDNNWSLTKFCVSQFKSAHTEVNGKADEKRVRETVVKAKSFEDVLDIAGGVWSGEDDFKQIVRAIEGREHDSLAVPMEVNASSTEEPLFCSLSRVLEARTSDDKYTTPPGSQNPHPPPPVSEAHLLPDAPRTLPALISGKEPMTPTHSTTHVL